MKRNHHRWSKAEQEANLLSYQQALANIDRQVEEYKEERKNLSFDTATIITSLEQQYTLNSQSTSTSTNPITLP
jgi:hypothetical protein